MKKTILFGMTFLIGFALISAPVFAGPGCDASKKDASACAKICGIKTAQKADAKGEDTDGKLISSHADCNYKGKCENLTLNISGMTCTGCETSITKALTGEEGVIRVISIDHKTGKGVICYDPDKVETSHLASVVTKSGYKAEVIPANATTADYHHEGCPYYMSKSTSVEKVDKAEEKEETPKQDY